MLSKLHIINFGIIKEMEVSFKEGFSVITGESGAGKSLILQALELILGSRLDSKLILNKEKKSIIEGEFILDFSSIGDLFELYEIEKEEKIILRREILPSGKSRSFINDSLVSLEILSHFSSYLVDIHNQFDHRFIHQASLQLDFLDKICNHKEELKNYKNLFLEYKKIKENLNSLEEKKNRAIQKNEQINFLVKELNEIKFSEIEFFELEKKNKEQTHFKKLKTYLKEANDLLNQNPSNLISQLKELSLCLEKASDLVPTYKELSNRLNSISIELLDISDEVNKWDESLLFDKQEALSIEEKLAKIYHLQAKHRCSTIKELIKIKENLNKEIHEVEKLTEEIGFLSKELEKVTTELSKKANSIERKRKSLTQILSVNIESALQSLDIQEAKIVFEITTLEEFNEKGKNSIKMYFSANKGVPLTEIQKSASGGEQARLMLVLKSIVCNYEDFGTLMLDEIDVGISGKNATKMAFMIEKIAEKLQVIAISHQPQLAAKASCHLKVYKKLVEKKTFTFIKELNFQEQVEEIAQMISGPHITNAAREQAIELLKK